MKLELVQLFMESYEELGFLYEKEERIYGYLQEDTRIVSDYLYSIEKLYDQLNEMAIDVIVTKKDYHKYSQRRQQLIEKVKDALETIRDYKRWEKQIEILNKLMEELDSEPI